MSTAVSRAEPRAERFRIGPRAISTAAGVVVMWASVVVAGVFAPDLVTGANHEHFQLAAVIGWPLGAVGTGMILLAAVVGGAPVAEGVRWYVFGTVVAAIWIAVALTSVLAPAMVTGTDPTTVPLAALVAPIFAVLGTAFASIYVAGSGRAEDSMR